MDLVARWRILPPRQTLVDLQDSVVGTVWGRDSVGGTAWGRDSVGTGQCGGGMAVAHEECRMAAHWALCMLGIVHAGRCAPRI
eukprot:349907-Chlamydomonas_euryale.AAC.11